MTLAVWPAGWTVWPTPTSSVPRFDVHPVDHYHDVVGYWPGARTVRGAEQYMQAMEELLGLLPDLNSTYG